MNDEGRNRLGSMVERFGPEIVLDLRRCEALLRHLCGQFPRELEILFAALRAGAAHGIHRTPMRAATQGVTR